MKLSFKAARVNKGLTQAAAAEALGVTRATLSRYETEKSKPSYDLVQKMAKLYDCNF